MLVNLVVLLCFNLQLQSVEGRENSKITKFNNDIKDSNAEKHDDPIATAEDSGTSRGGKCI
jgi:hypothetical protein